MSNNNNNNNSNNNNNNNNKVTENILKELLPTKSDYLRVSTNKDLIKFLERHNKTKELESVEFSDSTLKVNKRGKEQQRDLIITNLAIYNFLPKKYGKAQRCIPLSKLKGIALSRHSDELLFQVRNEYDYLFRVVRRAEVLEVVNKYIEKLCGQKLKVTFSDNLNDIKVTKSDLKQGKVVDEPELQPSRSSDSTTTTSEMKVSAIRRGSESDEQEEKPIEGWLCKKGHSNNIWRRRFFRLGGSNLRYYEARTKGSCMLSDGLARPWRNNRYNVISREALLPSTPDLLDDIFSDNERREAFIRYARSKFNNENAEFCAQVQIYRRTESEKLKQLAENIMNTYLVNGAPQEISTPLEARRDVFDLIKDNKLTNDIFDGIYRVVLAYMRVSLLPQYLNEAKKQLEKLDLTIHKDLSDEQKKQETCTGCQVRFSMMNVMRRRTLCQYCNLVYCSICVTKQTLLPRPFDDHGMISVCDMCYGILNPQQHVNQKTEFAFTFASPQRTKPLNLAAESDIERDSWVTAINKSRKMCKGDSNECNKNHLEGWLWKEDPTTKSWRRRYFVLAGDRLWYYEMGLKGNIPLTQGIGVSVTNEIQPTLAHHEAAFGGFISNTDFSYRFNITDNDRLYQVAADDEQQLQYWIDALQKSIKQNMGIDTSGEEKIENLTGSEAYHQSAPEGRVTFVFTDVQSSTKLWENAPDGMNEALELHDDLLRVLLKKFNGYEVKTEGDAFMVTFFNSLDAILWCINVQRELLKLNWPDQLLNQDAAAKEWAKDDPNKEKDPIFAGIRIRMGIHVGEPSARRNPITGRMDYFGQPVNRSARVADSAHGGQIICTQEVKEEFDDSMNNGKSFDEQVAFKLLGEYKYKGIQEMVAVYQISTDDLAGRDPFPDLRLHK